MSSARLGSWNTPTRGAADMSANKLLIAIYPVFAQFCNFITSRNFDEDSAFSTAPELIQSFCSAIRSPGCKYQTPILESLTRLSPSRLDPIEFVVRIERRYTGLPEDFPSHARIPAKLNFLSEWLNYVASIFPELPLAELIQLLDSFLTIHPTLQEELDCWSPVDQLFFPARGSFFQYAVVPVPPDELALIMQSKEDYERVRKALPPPSFTGNVIACLITCCVIYSVHAAVDVTTGLPITYVTPAAKAQNPIMEFSQSAIDFIAETDRPEVRSPIDELLTRAEALEAAVRVKEEASAVEEAHRRISTALYQLRTDPVVEVPLAPSNLPRPAGKRPYGSAPNPDAAAINGLHFKTKAATAKLLFGDNPSGRPPPLDMYPELAAARKQFDIQAQDYGAHGRSEFFHAEDALARAQFDMDQSRSARNKSASADFLPKLSEPSARAAEYFLDDDALARAQLDLDQARLAKQKAPQSAFNHTSALHSVSPNALGDSLRTPPTPGKQVYRSAACSVASGLLSSTYSGAHPGLFNFTSNVLLCEHLIQFCAIPGLGLTRVPSSVVGLYDDVQREVFVTESGERVVRQNELMKPTNTSQADPLEKALLKNLPNKVRFPGSLAELLYYYDREGTNADAQMASFGFPSTGRLILDNLRALLSFTAETQMMIEQSSDRRTPIHPFLIHNAIMHGFLCQIFNAFSLASSDCHSIFYPEMLMHEAPSRRLRLLSTFSYSMHLTVPVSVCFMTPCFKCGDRSVSRLCSSACVSTACVTFRRDFEAFTTFHTDKPDAPFSKSTSVLDVSADPAISAAADLARAKTTGRGAPPTPKGKSGSATASNLPPKAP